MPKRTAAVLPDRAPKAPRGPSLTVRLPSLSWRQLEAIQAAEGLTQVQTIIVALDRLYQQSLESPTAPDVRGVIRRGLADSIVEDSE